MPGICNGNSETVVLCHEGGAGMGRKNPDFIAAHGCSDCHDEADGRTRRNADRAAVRVWFLEGVLRTQMLIIASGINYAGK